MSQTRSSAAHSASPRQRPAASAASGCAGPTSRDWRAASTSGQALAPEPNRELTALSRSLPPGSAFSGLTAARVRGLDLVAGAPTEVTVPREAAVRTRVGLKVRRGILGPQDVIKVDGMPVTSTVRTWFDLMRHQPLIEAVAALDWALHRRPV